MRQRRAWHVAFERGRRRPGGRHLDRKPKAFPEIVGPLNIDVRSADEFIADTIALDTGRAVAAVRRMRERMKMPERSAEMLLVDMEANGLTETVDVLRPYAQSL